MTPKPLVSFRAKPSPRAHVYFDVKIFATTRELRAYARSITPPFAGRIDGACRTERRTWFTGRRARTSPRMGEIMLAVTHLGAGIVSHECMHAALGWARRRQLVLKAMEHEELACYALTNLVRTIYRRVYAAKLLDQSPRMTEPRRRHAA